MQSLSKSKGKLLSVTECTTVLKPFVDELLAFDRVIRKSKHRFKTLRKRKWFYLCELWAIELDRGSFTRKDMAQIMGYQDKIYKIENYWNKLIRENWIIQVQTKDYKYSEASPKPRAVVTSFFLSVSSSLVHSLGEYSNLDAIGHVRPLGLRFDGGLLRAIRQDIGMHVNTVAEKLGVKPATVARYETGARNITVEQSDKLIKLFYFRIHPRYWTEEVKEGIKSGALPWPHFEKLKETNLFPSRTAWDEFQVQDRPRIFKAQARRAEAEQLKAETIKQINEEQNGQFGRQDFFQEE